MCTFWSLCSHVCEPNLSWKVVENEFRESWKTLEFGLFKSLKVLENSILLSVRTLYIWLLACTELLLLQQRNWLQAAWRQMCGQHGNTPFLWPIGQWNTPFLWPIGRYDLNWRLSSIWTWQFFCSNDTNVLCKHCNCMHVLSHQINTQLLTGANLNAW